MSIVECGGSCLGRLAMWDGGQRWVEQAICWKHCTLRYYSRTKKFYWRLGSVSTSNCQWGGETTLGIDLLLFRVSFVHLLLANQLLTRPKNTHASVISEWKFYLAFYVSHVKRWTLRCQMRQLRNAAIVMLISLHLFDGYVVTSSVFIVWWGAVWKALGLIWLLIFWATAGVMRKPIRSY